MATLLQPHHYDRAGRGEGESLPVQTEITFPVEGEMDFLFKRWQCFSKPDEYESPHLKESNQRRNWSLFARPRADRGGESKLPGVSRSKSPGSEAQCPEL